MAKYKPIDMVKEYHGKICQHSDKNKPFINKPFY